ncbi:Sulfate-transporting ATPase [Lentibacillus sp. JNUCC-1]|uniref:sugar ABC transporter ATP-binding protein n=1 Tax=Lentibacillus sp. JNUCC-1 TaxID=2654513 RepID=UPI0012E7495B|nr:sugar ABC transporter ATP-binding protein [Lentibacillus sp. JNUCC-1]MUV37201.1 Sulfate-transporting ATPase [Lentibacillus sp. JNUCC-1]
MIIEMENIKKSFGSNNVLKEVSLTIQGGDICALLGENGAGKSTLMNILGGVHQMDAGAIKINGEPVSFTTPSDSLNAGIAFIHQELNLINDLPIYENMFLSRELKTKFGTLDLKGMITATAEIFKQMNIDLDPRTMVKDLDSSYKQIVEICRAMMTNASIIIMDEPTTSLTEQEIARVFEMMRTMKTHDVGIIFISHKLNEVKQVCNRYAVLRDGNLVSEGDVADVTTDDLARFMVGFDVRTESLRREKELGREVLRLENLTSKQLFKDINLTVRAGEILGVTGLLGDGRSELFQSVFGANDPPSGQIYLDGQAITIHDTTEALEKGIAYLPRNRKENAILPDMNIIENAAITTWPKFSRGGVIDINRHEEAFAGHRKTLRLKMGELTDSITSLSGGNQQKVVLAKWLATNPEILILDNPTQGVDVGAKEDIYDIILKLAEDQIAIIVLSGEAQEIIRLCDRAVVMYHGVIQGEVTDDKMTEHEIMRLATGGN